MVNIGDVFDVKYFGLKKRSRKEKVSRKALLDKPEGYVAPAPRERSNDRRPPNRRRD